MKVEASSLIERPVAEVFAVAADPTNDPLWASVVAEARQTSEGSLGEGRLRSVLGRRMFEPAPAGTRVAFAGDGTSGLFLNLLEPRVTAAAKPAVRRDLVNLKAVLEASVRPTTAVPTGGAGGALRSVA